MSMMHPSRRQFLAMAGAGIFSSMLARDAFAQLQSGTALHGISPFGDLKYPADFPHFEYVNPDAPQGGRISTLLSQWAFNQAPDTFDTLNSYVLRGNGAAGMDLTFATLMTGSADEMGAYYCYAARTVTLNDDRVTWVFELNPDATFHDATPITADDVVFSIEILRDEGHENLASTLRLRSGCIPKAAFRPCSRSLPVAPSFRGSGGMAASSARRCRKRPWGPGPTGCATIASAVSSNSSALPIIGATTFP
jgi:ABC-type oligopeptide transport system substrate-binding subunit